MLSVEGFKFWLPSVFYKGGNYLIIQQGHVGLLFEDFLTSGKKKKKPLPEIFCPGVRDTWEKSIHSRGYISTTTGLVVMAFHSLPAQRF